MAHRNVWHRVGAPTWKRSGTLVFSAVMGVLLIGGTAMAANLGLLTPTASGARGHRLEVPRPPLVVTLPTSEPAPPINDSTSAPENLDEADSNDGDIDDSPPADSSTTETSGNDPDDGVQPASARPDDDSDNDDSNDAEADDSDDDGDSDDFADDGNRRRGAFDVPRGKVGAPDATGDGRLDDD